MPAKTAQDGSVTVAFRVTAEEAAALGAHPNTAARELVRAHAQGAWLPVQDHLRVVDELKRERQEEADRESEEVARWDSENRQILAEHEAENARLRRELQQLRAAAGASPEMTKLRLDLAAARQERDGAFVLLEEARGELADVETEGANYWDAGYRAARAAFAPSAELRAKIARELAEYVDANRRPNWDWVAAVAFDACAEREVCARLRPFEAAKLASALTTILPRRRAAWIARRTAG